MMLLLSPSRLLALATFAFYFISILVLFIVVFSSIRKSCVNTWASSRPLTFSTLALASLLHTWYHMIRFLQWSFVNYEKSILVLDEGHLDRVMNWLEDTALFEQAWSAVCTGAMNWWWSEQLCLFTVGTWTVFLIVQGRKHGIHFLWAYMLLGQLVAISVATNLFLLALSLSKPKSAFPSRSTQLLSPRIWLSILLAMVTVAVTPFASTRLFLWNLLAMHGLLFTPLLEHQQPHHQRHSITLRALYGTVALVSIVLRARTSFAAFSSLPEADRSISGFVFTAVDVLRSHPAQSSIGWDVIWTTISFIIWLLLGVGLTRFQTLWLLAAAAPTSISVAAPSVMASAQESQAEKDE